ncbi:MAG: DNA glycosylase [Clostridia bacterium]|nr:DNA glycosylase [Clostridia bacterium]
MENLVRIEFNKEYFNPAHTLECGQVFRFKKYEKGYLVFSSNKCAYLYQQENKTIIECEKQHKDYFYNYFDLGKDYSAIYNRAVSQKVEILTLSANTGKGIRILNQNIEETLFSFIISQNNNIPRIKSIIEKLSNSLGEEKEFLGVKYKTFPTAKSLASMPLEFFYEVGLGYRAGYIKGLAEEIEKGLNLNALKNLETNQLRKELLKIKGVGPKVADCVLLFAFNKTNSFPVDTWIEKVYKEDFNGKEKIREKQSQYFTNRFKEDSGYFQQYLFHYKRNYLK